MTEMGESNVTLKNRRLLKMDGVSEVLSFDEDFVSVATALGKVAIEDCIMPPCPARKRGCLPAARNNGSFDAGTGGELCRLHFARRAVRRAL